MCQSIFLLRAGGPQSSCPEGQGTLRPDASPISSGDSKGRRVGIQRGVAVGEARSGRGKSWVTGLLILALTGSACLGGRPKPPPLEGPVGVFSPAMAIAHQRKLESWASGLPWSKAGPGVRAYAEQVMDRLRAESIPLSEPSGRGIVFASVRGRSSDELLVVVPYGPLGVTDEADLSTLALALELARAFASAPRSYAITFALIDVGPSDGMSPADLARPPLEAMTSIQARRIQRGRDLLEALGRADRRGRIRAALVLDVRADANARIARDLRSHPVLQPLFWAAAARPGQGELFPEVAPWSAPAGVQDALYEDARAPVVTLADFRWGDPAGWARLIQDREKSRVAFGQSPGSSAWTGVGVVAFDGLGGLIERFERVDDFVSAP